MPVGTMQHFVRPHVKPRGKTFALKEVLLLGRSTVKKA